MAYRGDRLVLYHGTPRPEDARLIASDALVSGYPNEPDHAVLTTSLEDAWRWAGGRGGAVVEFVIPPEVESSGVLVGPMDEGNGEADYGIDGGYLWIADYGIETRVLTEPPPGWRRTPR